MKRSLSFLMSCLLVASTTLVAVPFVAFAADEPKAAEPAKEAAPAEAAKPAKKAHHKKAAKKAAEPAAPAAEEKK